MTEVAKNPGLETRPGNLTTRHKRIARAADMVHPPTPSAPDSANILSDGDIEQQFVDAFTHPTLVQEVVGQTSNSNVSSRSTPPVFGVDRIPLRRGSKRTSGVPLVVGAPTATEPIDLSLRSQVVIDQNGTLVPKPETERIVKTPKRPALKPGDIMPIRPGWVELSGIYGSDETYELGINRERRTDMTLVEIRRPEGGIAPTFVLKDPNGKLHFFSRSGSTWRGKSRK